MLFSFAIMFLLSLLLGSIFKKLNLPSLLGILLSGILLGPYVFNMIDDSILSISSELRQVALIIILLRAGFSLNIKDLMKVGRSAILMSFIPACMEILGMIILAPLLLGVSILDAAIMGSVIAAVSPAVIVPRMIKLMDEGYGTDKNIPQLIMAGASVDDIFVIILFTFLTSLALNNDVSLLSILDIPISIITGIGIGWILGKIFSKFFKQFKCNTITVIIILLSISFLLVSLENSINDVIAFSALLSVMMMAITLNQNNQPLSKEISLPLSNIWIVAEIILFTLVGAIVDISYVESSGLIMALLIILVLLFRMSGVLLCLIKTPLNLKERLFCMVAYLPKATVQASIGGIPLAMGLACGNIVLTCAVISIILTAPIGAICIDTLYQRLLNKN
ncbi:MAG: cation:proton antiporter [Coprobacillaceae bacterium]